MYWLMVKAVKRRVGFQNRSESPGRCEGAREQMPNMVLELGSRLIRLLRVRPLLRFEVFKEHESRWYRVNL